MPGKNRLRYAIAVDLGGTNVRVGVVSSQGKLIKQLKYPIPRRRSKTTLLDHMGEMIQVLLEWSRSKKIRIAGIGLACPGVLSIQKGIIFQSPNIPEWKNVPIQKHFQKRFGLPVFLENDANAAALGEAWAGAGKKTHSAICVTLGTGVGGGIILNDKIWHGANESAGEIGHMVVRDDGRKCKCGNWGCLEVYASATAIVRQAKEALKQFKGKSLLRELNGLTSQKIFAAARKGDKLALKVTRFAAEMLGTGLASLVHVINPEIIIIGGGVSENGALLFKPVRTMVKKRCFPQAVRTLKIVPAQLGDQAGMIGAARAFFLSQNHHAKIWIQPKTFKNLR